MSRHVSCIVLGMNLNKLLLELDPRKDNGAAIARARFLAARFDASIDVLVSEQSPIVPTAVIAEPAMVAVVQEQYRDDIDKWLERQVAALDDVRVETCRVTTTGAQPRYEAILEQAEASNADLIVRISGEHGRLKRLLLGATDWDLIRNTKQPLWLVPPDGADISGANVMAAVDPTHAADEQMKLDKRILGFARDLGAALDGALHVYHTYSVNPMVIPGPTGVVYTRPKVQAGMGLAEQIESAHKKSVDELINGYDLDDDNVHVLEGDPAAEIDEVIDENGIRVVVAGCISRSWLDRLLIGSTAESLLDAISCDFVLLKGEP